MKRTMTAIAALTMSAGLAYAEGHASMDNENLIRTRDITGGEIYVMSSEMDDATWGQNETYDEVNTEWNDIGEIEDIILSKDGQMIGIVAEIGGFLDIADKHVMIPVEDVKLIAVDDQSYAYVTRMTEEQLEEMEGVDEGWWN
ncbi:PRC-barrel domain-containing protein [Aestuariibius insulae]|uniref:PRC-barrel domain-containing protein n=1 Tax=Aestuariibius insulae TaxID=2058287 RepID=UPI00345EF357